MENLIRQRTFIKERITELAKFVATNKTGTKFDSRICQSSLNKINDCFSDFKQLYDKILRHSISLKDYKEAEEYYVVVEELFMKTKADLLRCLTVFESLGTTHITNIEDDQVHQGNRNTPEENWFHNTVHSNHGSKHNQLVSIADLSSSTVSVCVVCNHNHRTWKCFKFKKIKIDSRQDFAVNNNLCDNCLGKSHNVFEYPLVLSSTTSSESCTLMPNPESSLLDPTTISATLMNTHRHVEKDFVHCRDNLGKMNLSRIIGVTSSVTGLTKENCSFIAKEMSFHNSESPELMTDSFQAKEQFCEHRDNLCEHHAKFTPTGNDKNKSAVKDQIATTEDAISLFDLSIHHIMDKLDVTSTTPIYNKSLNILDRKDITNQSETFLSDLNNLKRIQFGISWSTNDQILFNHFWSYPERNTTTDLIKSLDVSVLVEVHIRKRSTKGTLSSTSRLQSFESITAFVPSNLRGSLSHHKLTWNPHSNGSSRGNSAYTLKFSCTSQMQLSSNNIWTENLAYINEDKICFLKKPVPPKSSSISRKIWRYKYFLFKVKKRILNSATSFQLIRIAFQRTRASNFTGFITTHGYDCRFCSITVESVLLFELKSSHHLLLVYYILEHSTSSKLFTKDDEEFHQFSCYLIQFNNNNTAEFGKGSHKSCDP